LHTVPLGWEDWLLIFEISIPIFIATEVYKMVEWALMNKKETQNINNTDKGA